MKLKLKITGKKVHDVGYRAFLLESAEDLRMQGFFAQNTVEEGQQAVIVYIEGNDASVERFKKISNMQRPDKADVSDIAFEDCSDDVEDIKSFAAIFQARQLRKGISAIIRMEERQDLMVDLQKQMLGKQDVMIDKQDLMIDKQDQMLGKMDLMLEKQDKTIDKLEDVRQDIVVEIRSSTDAIVSEIRDSRERSCAEHRDSHAELKNYLDERLGKMDEEISRVKARIGM